MPLRIIEATATKSGAYTNGVKRTKTVGAMLHSVGVAQPNAEVFVRNHNSATVTVMPHGFMGADGILYQTLPWDRRGWHGASGSKGSVNDTHIGVEMTEPASIQYTGTGASYKILNRDATEQFLKEQYGYAVELFAYLSELHGWNPLAPGVIISHAEGYKLGIASGHADPEHLWNAFGLSMDQFRKDVNTMLNGGSNSNNTEELYKVVISDLKHSDANAAAKAINADGYSCSIFKQDEAATKFPYVIKVIKPNCPVQSGPGANYSTTMQIKDTGAYTITEVQNGFGRLKSGAGWISMDFTQPM